MRRTYDLVWGAFEREKLPPKTSKSEQPHKNKEVAILVIELHKKRSLEPNRQRLANLVNETAKRLKFPVEVVNCKNYRVVGTGFRFWKVQ